MIEWTDRNIANTTFEGTARELLRMQLASPIHPLGEMTFNPTARRGDPDWRVMYVGVGDSGTGEQRDIRRLNPQRLDNLGGKILRIVPDLREHTGHEHGERERALSHPERQPVRRRSRARARRSGPRACAILIGWSGTSIPRSRGAAPDRVQHRADRVGDGGDRQEGRELRLPVARGPAGDDVRRDGAGAGGRHHPGADHRHGHARHGEADLPGDRLPACRQRRRRDCRRLHLSRQRESRR